MTSYLQFFVVTEDRGKHRRQRYTTETLLQQEGPQHQFVLFTLPGEYSFNIALTLLPLGYRSLQLGAGQVLLRGSELVRLETLFS